MTYVGTAQVSTAQEITPIFASSLLLDGDSDYVTLADSTDWDFGSGDFTVDCWVYFTSVGVDQCICVHNDTSGASNYWFIKLQTTNVIRFYAAVGGLDLCAYDFSWSPNTGQWYHFALVRSGTSIYMFVDGTSQVLTPVIAIGSNAMPNPNGLFTIGGFNYEGTIYYYFHGYIDEFRISKGVARWTSNFTRPAYPYDYNPPKPRNYSYFID